MGRFAACTPRGVERELCREGRRVPPPHFLPQQLSHPWGAEPAGWPQRSRRRSREHPQPAATAPGGVLRDELGLGLRGREEEGPLPIAEGRWDRPPTPPPTPPRRSAPPPAPCAPPADGGARCGAGGGAASGGGAARSPRAAAGLSGGRPAELRGPGRSGGSRPPALSRGRICADRRLPAGKAPQRVAPRLGAAPGIPADTGCCGDGSSPGVPRSPPLASRRGGLDGAGWVAGAGRSLRCFWSKLRSVELPSALGAARARCPRGHSRGRSGCFAPRSECSPIGPGRGMRRAPSLPSPGNSGSFQLSSRWGAGGMLSSPGRMLRVPALGILSSTATERESGTALGSALPSGGCLLLPSSARAHPQEQMLGLCVAASPGSIHLGTAGSPCAAPPPFPPSPSRLSPSIGQPGCAAEL